MINAQLSTTDREYGHLGSLGVAVPQANPVVEPEMATLLPAGFSMLVTRLQGSRSDSRQRLIDYLFNLPESLEAYDTARVDVLGYACTGSSYLVGAEVERRALDAAAERFGYPIISSADALRIALEHIGARRVAVFAPYPPFLVEASKVYWQANGLDVADCASVQLDTSDTRDIYSITTPVVLSSFKQLRWQDSDAIMFTGTGMPTLRALTEVSSMTGKPVLSSNLCLAWAMVRAAGGEASLSPARMGEPLFGGWAERLPVTRQAAAARL